MKCKNIHSLPVVIEIKNSVQSQKGIHQMYDRVNTTNLKQKNRKEQKNFTKLTILRLNTISYNEKKVRVHIKRRDSKSHEIKLFLISLVTTSP